LTDHTKLLFTLLQNIKKCGRQAERSYDTGVCGLKKNKYFVLESSILGVKTSPSMEITEPENKMQLLSTKH